MIGINKKSMSKDVEIKHRVPSEGNFEVLYSFHHTEQRP